MTSFKIGSREIGESFKPYFIADIAANHDGDLNRAFALIELAKKAGADAAKFQNFKAETIVSKHGFEAMGGQLSHQKNWGKPVFEVYKDASIPDDWTHLLKEKCNEVGIEYMTSPYDEASVDLADEYSNCFKIGSGDITWTDMLAYIAKKGKPVLLATGASSMEDVNRAMQTIQQYNKEIVLMQCNTNYTASRENFNYINLNVLTSFKAAYPNAILGLSDHTFGCETVLGAIALGARVIEKHFTDDNERKGPDHRFSMNPTTWRTMVDSAENLFAALGDGAKRIEDNEKDTVMVQRRAIYFCRDLPAGTVVRQEDLFPVRPIQSGELPPYEADRIIGKRVIRDVKADTGVKMEDFEA